MAQYVERLDVSISNIDFSVTDRAGKPVRGLTRDDFEVTEDGKPQTITNFSAYELPAVAASAMPVATHDTDVADPPRPRPRLIILFVDIDDIEPIRRRQFFGSVQAFFNSTFREGDMATILTWNHRIRIVLPPTSSWEAVGTAIDVFARMDRWSETEIMRQTAQVRIEQAERDVEFARSLGIVPIGFDSQAEVDFQEWLIGEQRCSKIKRKALEVRNIVTSIARVDMQKLLIFASDDLSLHPERTCDTAAEIRALTNAANAHGVTIHAFHPSGARARLVIGPERGGFLPGARDPSPMAQESNRTFDQSSGLLRLAHETGGLVAIGAGMSAERLEQAAAELEQYYSIGYRFSSGNEDRPRSIKVTTKNPTYRVRARRSVVRLSETARLRDELTANLYLPSQHQSQSPAFDVRIEGVTRERRFSLVHLRLSISARDLVLLSSRGKGRGSFSVFVVAGRELGDASPVAELKQDFEAAPDPGDSRMTYEFATRVRPDTRRLSIAVRNNVSGEMATKVVTLKGLEQDALDRR